MSDQTYKMKIKSSYLELRSLYVGVQALEKLRPGKVAVLLDNDASFSVEGRLNSQGLLSGMAELHTRLRLKRGDELSFSVRDSGTIIIHGSNLRHGAPAAEEPPAGTNRTPTVFERQKLRHIHIEPFRPENLNNWEPENETDVHIAFGVLQEFTDYQYCCGISSALLAKLGARYEEATRPNAIVIDRTTYQYLMAEWKKYSSEYKKQHSPEDVDVLVCWHDDERDRSALPPRVLSLHAVAREAATTALTDD